MTPLVGTRGVIVNFTILTVVVVGANVWHFCSANNATDNISYLTNPQDILQTVDHGHCQHIVEEVCGVTVVVGGSTWTLSSWFGPPNI